MELREDEECRVVLIAGEYEAGLNSTDFSLLDVGVNFWRTYNTTEIYPYNVEYT